MAAVRHLGFVMPVWGPPTKGIWRSLSLCKIWLESMQQFWKYGRFSISRVWLENAYSRPEIEGFWGCWPPKWGAMWKIQKKGTSLRESASFEPSCVKIRRDIWPVGTLLKKRGINKNNFGYISPMCPEAPWTDMHLIWHSRRGRRRNHLWQIFWWSVEGVDSVGGRKLPFPIDKASGR